MSRVSIVPFDRMDSELQAIMRASDETLGGSEWIQTFAHTPELYKTFVSFYYRHIMAASDGISLKLTELVRRKVAEFNQCKL